ncbi:Bug family tripartite tricarboxylate transporter substrate binding protein [Aeromicrobium sp. CTD01-1L150]|uniref:Bug family tripartite tricarboxylate transporter substrate binding protein n=1 Tax=Aeromicrobium sp. CTD01-1L150 TaxID=3341830 RepID=UPI0035BF6921
MIALVATAALVIGGCASRGDGEGASELPDKVTLLVPVPPGASFDTFARALAPRLEEELGTTIAVENSPGASGMVAMSDLARSRPDGSTLILWQMGSMAIAQLQELEQVTYDLTELSYVGNFADADHMLFVSADAGISSLDEALDHEGFTFASGEVGSLGNTSQDILAEVLDWDARFVTGYADQGERLAAMSRGDADAVIGPVRTFKDLGRLDEVQPVLRLARDRHPDFPDVPTALEIESLDETALGVAQTHLEMGSLFFTVAGPADIPSPILDALREGFWEAANDEEVLADLEERGFTLVPETEFVRGEEVAERIGALLDPPEEYLRIISAGDDD